MDKIDRSKYRKATQDDLNERMDRSSLAEPLPMSDEEKAKHQAQKKALLKEMGGEHRPLTAADYNLRITI